MDQKILKNTTGADIEIDSVGILIPASGQLTINTESYLDLASDDSVAELTPLINAGDIVVNNGTEDFSAADGIVYLKTFTAQYSFNELQLRDVDTPAASVRFTTMATFGGFTIMKDNTSGFMSYMPNATTAQIIAGNPASANGVNQWFLDADNQGVMFLNTLPGAGSGADVVATDGAALRPDVDLTSSLGSPAQRWQKLYTTGNRTRVSQTAHGFTIPSWGFLPVYYNNVAGEYQRANANDTTTAADVFVVDIIDDDTFEIMENGYLFGAHGLNVGEWYVLRSGLAGLIIGFTTLTGTDVNVQYLAFPVDANTLILRPDPIFTRDFFIPQDIAILENWIQGSIPTLTAGTDRILIASVIWEDDTGTQVSNMQIGGQTAQLVTEQSITSGFQNGNSMCYWTDAQIELMTNNTLTINWTSGVPLSFQSASCIIEHVNQATPFNSTNTDSGAGSTDTLDADVNTLAGGYAVASASGGNTGMGFTNNGSGWTRKLDITITSADGVVDDKLISSAATPENVNFSISGSNRHVLIAAAFQRRES